MIILRKKIEKKIYLGLDTDQHRARYLITIYRLAIKNNNLESEVETFNKKFFFRKKKILLYK